MFFRTSLVGSSVISLNVWQANKVYAAEPSTSELPTKKKIRPSEVCELNFQGGLLLFVLLAFYCDHVKKV